MNFCTVARLDSRGCQRCFLPSYGSRSFVQSGDTLVTIAAQHNLCDKITNTNKGAILLRYLLLY